MSASLECGTCPKAAEESKAVRTVEVVRGVRSSELASIGARVRVWLVENVFGVVHRSGLKETIRTGVKGLKFNTPHANM